MTTFRTMGGREFTVDEGEFPALVKAMRMDMLNPSATNQDYMDRIVGLIYEMQGETIPAGDEKGFIQALMSLGVVEQVNQE